MRRVTSVPTSSDQPVTGYPADDLLAMTTGTTEGRLWANNGTAWAPVSPDEGHAGMLIGNPFSYSGVALTASRAFFQRFVPKRRMLVDRIAFVTTIAAGANDAVDVGIYDIAGVKLVSSGATSGKLNATAGVQTVTFTAQQLEPNTPYLAALSSGTQGGAAVTVAQDNINGALRQLFGTALAAMDGFFVNSSHPLPGTVVAQSGTVITNLPILAIRES